MNPAPRWCVRRSMLEDRSEELNAAPAGGFVLRHLTAADEVAFREAVEAFCVSDPGWSFAFEYDDSEPFARYVERLEGWRHGRGVPRTFVPNSYYVGVVGGEIVGRVSLRHELNDFLAACGGHIGYGVTPGFRGRGYATRMLGLALRRAADLRIERALLFCNDENLASRRVIEKNGGEYNGRVRHPEGQMMRRYWIETPR